MSISSPGILDSIQFTRLPQKNRFRLYAKDFDGNGSIDPIVSRFIQGEEYPVHPRETLTEQIVSLKRVLTTYELYGKSSIQDILSARQLDGAQIYLCNNLASAYIENLGNGNFHCTPFQFHVKLQRSMT
jgi:hypothetical protein